MGKKFKTLKNLKGGSRGNANSRGYNYRWQKRRKQWLTLHPLCEKCLEDDKLITATVIHHKLAHKGNYNLFWNESNWQALCKECHDKIID